MKTNRFEYRKLESEDFSEYLTRMSDHITSLENLSEGHKIWFTHKNPYGCWICDSLLLLRTIVQAVSEEEEAFLNTLSPRASSNNQEDEASED